MIRSSYGSSSVDPFFETNYKNAKANGVPIGVYHYSYATSVTKAATEVKFLISTLAGKQLEYPVCVDIEDSKSMGSLSKKTVTDIVLTYINALQAAGYYPVVYANKTWFTTHMDDSRLTGVDHWLAQYATKYTYTGAVCMWQYSSKGSVDGIVGNVDMDISYVDYAAKIKNLKLNGYK
jgi:GH25 family lysozyme M1 (1,4-beta-N-acetylmuramidase)